jgi:hypothetical protein
MAFNFSAKFCYHNSLADEQFDVRDTECTLLDYSHVANRRMVISAVGGPLSRPTGP